MSATTMIGQDRRPSPRSAGARAARAARGGASFFAVLKQAVTDFIDDGALSQAAAISFYTMFSLAPLLVIVIAIAGFVWDPEEVRGQILAQFGGLMGASGAEMIETLIVNAGAQRGSGVVATVIGAVTLLIGALGVFGQLKTALNTIWEVEPKPGRGIWGIISERLLSFTMVLCIAFLLLVSLIASAAISAAGTYMEGVLPIPAALMQAINLVAGFAVITLLFAAMYKILPDVQMRWRTVWIGALSTTLLFSVGKYLIGLYLGQTSTVSVYGAAGSLALVLIWMYYSSLIFLMGAEFTQAYAQRTGEQIMPSRHAQWTDSSASEGQASQRRRGLAPQPEPTRERPARQPASRGAHSRSDSWRRRRNPRPSPVAVAIGTLFWATAEAWAKDDLRREHARHGPEPDEM